MEKIHLENIDPRPKRNMHKDNPYRIFSIGYDTEKPHYYIKFLDNLGVEICLEISKELFDFFDRCELEDVAFMNEIKRHKEQPLLGELLAPKGGCSLQSCLMCKFLFEKRDLSHWQFDK